MPGEVRYRLVVSGGGTGGHVNAGIAIADEWKRRCGIKSEVLFVGARGRIEERIVPKAGYPLKLLIVGPLNRGSLNRVGLFRIVKSVFQLPVAFVQSAVILISFRPQAVIGVGGYSSGPFVLMSVLLGWIWGVKTSILEQNIVPGLTNRILGCFVDKIFSAFEIKAGFSRGNVRVTGNPVRSMIRPLPSAPYDRFTVFIFGGSQGAVGVNSLVLEALPHLGPYKKRIRFIHQTGEKDFDRVAEGHRMEGSDARVEKFIHDMSAAYAESSLLICRAGASTLSEIAAVGRAAVLIPLPHAADGHQEMNARKFEEKDAARVLLQEEGNGVKLSEIIKEIFENRILITEMEKRVKAFHRPEASGEIIDTVLEIVGKKD